MNSDRLEGLIAEYIARSESGEILDPVDFAHDHPEGGTELLAALQRIPDTESLFPSILSDLPGKIGPYRVLGEIGRGGMGRVLKVDRADRPGPPLALKLLTGTSRVNPRSMERLSREGKALQRLRHPGIVKVHEMGMAGSSPYLVMDLLRGKTLAKILREAREADGTGTAVHRSDLLQLPGPGPGPVRAARTAAGVARAVEAAHAEGLIHRDVKPGNVLLVEDDHPVLIDFGLAGGEAGPTLTGSGDVLGTPHYMAPEQARGERAVKQSDIYGIGAVLYEMLTLFPPHPGNDPLQVVEAVKERPVRRVRSFDPRIPRDLETIVHRCLAFPPSQRYPDAGVLANDLEATVKGQPITARRPGPVERGADFIRFHRRGTVVGAVVILIAALLGLLFLRDPGNSESRLRRAHDQAAMAWVEKNPEGLEGAARKIMQLAPDNPLGPFLLALAEKRTPDEVKDPALTALARGARLLGENRPREAVKALKQAVALAPGKPIPVVMLGMAARKGKMLDVAEEELTAAVRLLPRSAVLRRELALVYRANKRLADAEEILLAAVDIEPDAPRTWRELARVRYERQLKREEAERDFQAGYEAAVRALELAGEKASPSYWRILGFTLDMMKRFEESQRIYRKLLRKNPRSFKDQWYLAYSLDSAHRPVEARNEYEKCLKLKPGEPNAAANLAFFYAGARRKECADCRELYEKHPEFYDPGVAEKYTLMALRNGQGRSERRVLTLAQVARQIGRPQSVTDLFKQLKEKAHLEKDPGWAARLDRALWLIAREEK